ncbi:MAG: immunoglobulin domain-containing protein [Verrucomicrobiota bacterium]
MSPIGIAQTPGSVDLLFDAQIELGTTMPHVVLLGDGRAYVGGFPLARLESTGATDVGFKPDRNASVFALQPDGKIVVAYGSGVQRLRSNGSSDLTFTYAEVNLSGVSALAVQTDGWILAGGFFTNVNKALRKSIARLNPDGSVETNFTAGGGVNYRVNCLALQDDGKILVGGEFASVGGLFRNNIARLNKDGSPDTSFNPGWGADGAVRAVAIQPDRKIVAGGSFSLLDLTPRSRVARLNADGSLDASFKPGSGANDDVLTVAVQSDGKILIGGKFTQLNGVDCLRVARLLTDGTVDRTFDTSDGPDGQVSGLAVRPDGRVLIGGAFTKINGVSRQSIAQLHGNIEPPVAPTILQPPPDQQAQSGQTVSLNVVGSGTAPLLYQWSKDGIAITGATNVTLSITDVQPSDAGAYSVVVSNVIGSIITGPAALVVDGRPIITIQPSDLVVQAGMDTVFNASAAGPSPLTFQWHQDGQALSDGDRITGSTSQTLHLANVQSSDRGSYSLLVSNRFGIVFSHTAKLLVVPRNDVFAFPVEAPQLGGRLFGDNRYATKDPGEPNHAGNNGGRSLWFTWMAALDGRVVVDTIGSTFDTLLAVYYGTNLAALTLVVADDDGAGFAGTSRLVFNASANRRYLIAVDGYQGASGYVELNLYYEQPVFTAQLSSPSGPLQIELTAVAQSTVVVEASGDLKAWIPVSTNRVPEGGILRFTDDLKSTSQQQRFFRALAR